MQIISISNEKSQQFTVTLDGVDCTIKIHQRTTGLYMDVMVGDASVVQGALCLNCNKVIRYSALRASSGFLGDLFFADTQGSEDPYWSGLGTRYVLYYLTEDDLAS